MVQVYLMCKPAICCKQSNNLKQRLWLTSIYIGSGHTGGKGGRVLVDRGWSQLGGGVFAGFLVHENSLCLNRVSNSVSSVPV